MQSAYYFANCNGGNALGQYGACGLRHLRAIVPRVFHSGGIDMGDFKTARTLATSLLIAGLCISHDLLPLPVSTGARHYVGSNARHFAEFDIVGMHNGWFPIANVHRGIGGLSMIGYDDVNRN